MGTPAYYWGVTAQLKMVVDKFYSKDDQLCEQKKKLGIVAVGAADLDDREYELIFSKPVSAFAEGDLEKDEKTLKELGEHWKLI